MEGWHKPHSGLRSTPHSEESRVRINSFITGQNNSNSTQCPPNPSNPFAPPPVTAARVYVHTHYYTLSRETLYSLKNMHINDRGHIRR